MKGEMSQRSYAGWQRYWEQEPWGSWRDNMHAAIVSREMRRLVDLNARGKSGAVKLDQFMLRGGAERRRDASAVLFAFLGAASTTVSQKEAAKKLRITMGARKARGRAT